MSDREPMYRFCFKPACPEGSGLLALDVAQCSLRCPLKDLQIVAKVYSIEEAEQRAREVAAARRLLCKITGETPNLAMAHDFVPETDYKKAKRQGLAFISPT